MNVGYLIPIVCFWHTISTEAVKYKPIAVVNNIVSFIHCISFILHFNYDYNLGYATHMSIGFYIYDLLYIFSCIKTATATTEIKRRTPFILHHLAGIYVLNASFLGEGNAHILGGYAILEKSNVMLYISYHLRKEYTHHVRLNIIAEVCQLIFYSYYRLVRLSFFLYNHRAHFFRFHYITQILIIALYCMGVAWSCKLVKKNITNYNAVKDRNTD